MTAVVAEVLTPTATGGDGRVGRVRHFVAVSQLTDGFVVIDCCLSSGAAVPEKGWIKGWELEETEMKVVVVLALAMEANETTVRLVAEVVVPVTAGQHELDFDVAVVVVVVVGAGVGVAAAAVGSAVAADVEQEVAVEHSKASKESVVAAAVAVADPFPAAVRQPLAGRTARDYTYRPYSPMAFHK